jgi:Transposase DDE domain
MPYKHNESRRHKIKKSGYKVTNWHDYNNGLRQRGDFTIWFTEKAIVDWHPAKTGARGRPKEYSDIAIETAVFIRQVITPNRRLNDFACPCHES